MRHTRLLAGSAMAAAAAMTLVGCSSGSTDSGEQTVTMWIYPVIADEAAHRDYWDGLVKAYEAEHENVTVKYEIYPWANRDESLATAIAANKAPDLVYLIPDQLSTYQKSIEPMDEYLPAEQQDDILDNVADSITIDGKLMGAPLLTSANALMCDKNAFDAAGLTEYPATWDDLMEIAPALKEKGIYATQYFASPEVTLNMTFYPLLWQAGGSVFNEDGTEVAFNSKAGVEALTYITEMAKNGYIEPDLISTFPSLEQTAIATNQVACTWQSAPADVSAYWGDDAIVIKPPLENKEAVSYGTVGSLAMMKNSASKEAAGEFAAFATNAENVVEYDLAANYFSPLKSTGELYADNAIQGAIEAIVPTSTVGEGLPSSREVIGVGAAGIQAALVGAKSPEPGGGDGAGSAGPRVY